VLWEVNATDWPEGSVPGAVRGPRGEFLCYPLRITFVERSTSLPASKAAGPMQPRTSMRHGGGAVAPRGYLTDTLGNLALGAVMGSIPRALAGMEGVASVVVADVQRCGSLFGKEATGVHLDLHMKRRSLLFFPNGKDNVPDYVVLPFGCGRHWSSFVVCNAASLLSDDPVSQRPCVILHYDSIAYHEKHTSLLCLAG
jgi:hypothetical protein